MQLYQLGGSECQAIHYDINVVSMRRARTETEGSSESQQRPARPLPLEITRYSLGLFDEVSVALMCNFDRDSTTWNRKDG